MKNQTLIKPASSSPVLYNLNTSKQLRPAYFESPLSFNAGNLKYVVRPTLQDSDTPSFH